MAVPNDPEPNTQIFVLLLLVVVVLIIGSLKARKSDDDDITTSFKNIPYIFSNSKTRVRIIKSSHTYSSLCTLLRADTQRCLLLLLLLLPKKTKTKSRKRGRRRVVASGGANRVERTPGPKSGYGIFVFRVLCRFAFVCLARFESPLLTTHTFFQSSSHADEREEAFSHGERGVDAAREDGWDWRSHATTTI